jgi:hypothetical protein
MKIHDINKLFYNYKIISLGFNCFPKKFIDNFIGQTETNIFDYIGTSMWSINELSDNDFIDLFNWNYIKKITINNNRENNYLTNEKYYIRFMHDLKINYSQKYYNSIEHKYLRRISRLNSILNNSNKIIFIRYKETNNDRIIYDEYKEKFEIPEYENLIKFSIIIKNKFPNLNFFIIYLSHDEDDNIDNDNNIIKLKIYENNITWDNCHKIFKNIFIEKYELLFNILQK